MTTIAYHHKTKTIAYDSRVTAGGEIFTDEADKKREHNGVFLFLAGDTCDIEKCARAYPEATDIQDSPYGFIVENNEVSWINYVNGKPEVTCINHNQSAGSGGSYAIAAMDCGLGAVEAVKVAIGRDVYSGGEVKVFKL